MPRPISYAVFCLKKNRAARASRAAGRGVAGRRHARDPRPPVRPRSTHLLRAQSLGLNHDHDAETFLTSLFISPMRSQPTRTLFPYTTLFRSPAITGVVEMVIRRPI